MDPLPVVESIFPGHLAVGVLRTATVSARFSEPIDAFYIAFTPSFSLTTGGLPVAGTITISPGGRDVQFNASSLFEYGTTYTATIDAGTLSASGQALEDDVTWTFTIESPADWEWSAPVEFAGAPNVLYNYRWVGVDLDDAGNGCVIWTQAETGGGFRVYASRSAEGGPWATPAPLQASPEVSFSSESLVGMDGSGQILVVWSVLGTIYFNWAGVATEWGPPGQVIGPLGVEARLLNLFVDSDGNAQLIYYTDPAGGAQDDFIFAIRYDAALGWQAPVALGMRHATQPSFTGDRTGLVAVAWKGEGSNPGITARRFLPGSGWTAIETVDAPDAARPVERPNLATDGAGNVLAAWLKRLSGGSGQDFEIFTSRCTPATGWTQSAAGPAASNTYVAGALPQLALSQDGPAVITWMNNQDDRCWASYQATTGVWSTPEPIDLDSPDHQASFALPHFTVDGRVVLFGLERIFGIAAEYVNIWVTEFDPAAGWGSPTLLRSAENGFYWSVDRDADGRASLVWLESDITQTMWWSRYR